MNNFSDGFNFLNLILAVAAIATVILAIWALHYARQSAESSSDAAISAATTSERISAIAAEFSQARERDRILADERRLHEILGLVEMLQVISLSAGAVTPTEWIVNRNLLVGYLLGYEETFPVTFAVTQATAPNNANFGSARAEIAQALGALAARKKEIDFG